ncbi:hypothetical protein O181_027092 [Austropuccinia psidii MF-1]|uniref:Secreted protein n=1 Tax=Austropuccinia psidii MF-1 TaxID=1389203 RepID=A0A9Q3H1D0_9BASI|nr:hypothetical protein [Austropuccinia psidii MF-1]
MHLYSILCLLTISISSLMATQHTSCFNYFLEKDKCVFAKNGDKRCDPTPKVAKSAGTLSSHLKHGKRDNSHPIERRYATINKTEYVAGGDGICGIYDTNKQAGACLWSGSGGKPGWLSGSKTSNCGKTLYIQRQGNPSGVVFAPVVDGCSFGMTQAKDGCFEIYLTNKTFFDLKPTKWEQDHGRMFNLIWDFDNLYGNKSRNGPV